LNKQNVTSKTHIKSHIKIKTLRRKKAPLHRQPYLDLAWVSSLKSFEFTPAETQVREEGASAPFFGGSRPPFLM
jgi:hypothetical protein